MVPRTLDPGPDGTYPWFPRLPDGSPAWKDRCPPGYQFSSVPRGTVRQGWGLHEWLIDLTPYDADGKPIDPPTIPPDELRMIREQIEGRPVYNDGGMLLGYEYGQPVELHTVQGQVMSMTPQEPPTE